MMKVLLTTVNTLGGMITAGTTADTIEIEMRQSSAQTQLKVWVSTIVGISVYY